MPSKVMMQGQKGPVSTAKNTGDSATKSNVTWLVAQYKPNSHLKAVHNLESQGFQTFLPLYKNVSQKHQNGKSNLRPLFPGYIFVGFDSKRNIWQAISSSRGINRVVLTGTSPAVVPSKLIAELKARGDDDGVFCPLEVISPGEQVRIDAGRFANFLAVVDEIESDRRIWLLVDLLGQVNRVSATKEAISLC